ncbi:hypothetical protein GWC95_17040 [Sediminibacterium roseum]|uniref:YhhN-like protein n=1 Tax=Sediminibacterium roseum TaxID=1978412 RepID=A0ABX0A2J1_9BACT|nr:hypothetical protein [Sediminibacterium roseum]NCI51638.1 hypothetical protein [Sediminibacterium roseum]
MQPLNYYWILAFSYSIVFATVIGLVRYKKVLKSYRLFIVFACLGLLSEIVSTIMVEIKHNNAINANIYVLVEANLLVLLFYDWRSYNKRMLVFLHILLTTVWIGENLVFGSITYNNSFFRIFYALTIVILSIDQINVTMMHERKNLAKNAKFIICSLFVLYFAYKAIYEVFYFVRMPMSDRFYDSLFLILVYVNLFVNLGYALAALWIPTKQKFTLPY